MTANGMMETAVLCAAQQLSDQQLIQTEDLIVMMLPFGGIRVILVEIRGEV